MKYFKERTRTSLGEEVNDIVFKQNDRVLSISRESDGKIFFNEECDQYFGVSYSKADAIELLEEVILWIKNGEKE